MKKVLKVIFNVIRWIIVGTLIMMTIFALAQKGFLGALLILLSAIIIAPLNIIKKIRAKLRLKRVISIILAFIFLFVGIMITPVSEEPSDNNIVGTDLATDSSIVKVTETPSIDKNTSQPAVKVTPTATSEPTPTPTPIATPKPTATVKPTTTPKPTAKPTATPKPTAKPTATPNSTNTQQESSKTVYITETGEKYHSTKNCSGLSRAKKIYTSTLSSAKSMGLGPCSKCY